MSRSRGIARAALIVIVVAVCGLALEAAVRLVDGQPLTRAALVTLAPPTHLPARSGADRPDRKYVAAVPLAAGVKAAWYDEDPPARVRFPMDAELASRAAAHPTDPYTPFFAFNRRFLEHEICSGRSPGGLSDYFYFEPVDGSAYPTFRHLAHVSPPSWFVTNNYGWRGLDVTLARPLRGIRIAFVGASTTVDAYSMPFSHPELIEHWLTRWAAARGDDLRIDVINAGRTGVDSRSIAAIVAREIVPVDPDLVVFYEGANQFTPGGVLRFPLRRVFPKPAATFRERTRLERYSAVVRRALSAWDRFRGGAGAEPAKPSAIMSWPHGVSETTPDPHDARLPMDLPQVVRDLDAIRQALEPAGGELAVCSFIWFAQPGMTLDPVRDANIGRYLNDTLWPISYAHVRRMADFQNRVFRAYARDADAPLFDIDGEFPRDAALFDDPIHLRYPGLRLQGWIFLQHLVRLIDARVAAGRWPRQPAAALATHPAFDQPSRRRISQADVGSHCR
jgi:hypothetical protein